MQSSIAIIGNNSFIGKNIISNLSNYSFKEIDLLNNNVNEIDFSNTDAVIHLSAIVHQKKSIPEDVYFHVNSDLALETATEVKRQGVNHFIFFSTIKVYGDGGYEEVTYNVGSNCRPTDGYGKSKLDAEKRLMKLADDNFSVSIIRASMVYGKGVKANMYMLCKLIEKLPIIPLGGILNKRSMVSIDNLMITLDAVINKQETGIYLACDKNPVSTSELVKKLIQIINPNKKLVNLSPWIQTLLRVLFPSKMVRISGSFHVDATETHEKLRISSKLENMEIGLRKMLKN
jgi:UDP-glucose 4-epimerase